MRNVVRTDNVLHMRAAVLPPLQPKGLRTPGHPDRVPGLRTFPALQSTTMSLLSLSPPVLTSYDPWLWTRSCVFASFAFTFMFCLFMYYSATIDETPFAVSRVSHSYCIRGRNRHAILNCTRIIELTHHPHRIHSSSSSNSLFIIIELTHHHRTHSSSSNSLNSSNSAAAAAAAAAAAILKKSVSQIP